MRYISFSDFTLSGKAHITNQENISRQILSYTYDDNEEIKPTFSGHLNIKNIDITRVSDKIVDSLLVGDAAD